MITVTMGLFFFHQGHDSGPFVGFCDSQERLPSSGFGGSSTCVPAIIFFRFTTTMTTTARSFIPFLDTTGTARTSFP
jgi:hypothetical protein